MVTQSHSCGTARMNAFSIRRTCRNGAVPGRENRSLTYLIGVPDASASAARSVATAKRSVVRSAGVRPSRAGGQAASPPGYGRFARSPDASPQCPSVAPSVRTVSILVQ
jgi:hypothetical protein